MELIYAAIFTPDNEGGYTVEVPDLPGCVTEGDNLTDAIRMAAVDAKYLKIEAAGTGMNKYSLLA